MRRVARGCAGLAAAVLGVLAVVAPPTSRSTADDAPFPGMAGIDTSLPGTDSAVEVSGRGAFGDTQFTVNQTEDLTNQAISITWRGAPPTVSEPTTFFQNFVQIMQCWGEPDDLVPENPGPPPENCVWGGFNSTAGGQVPGFSTHFVTSRAFSNVAFSSWDPSVGTPNEVSGDVYRDFVAVDGTIVTRHVDATATGEFSQYWLNPYFDSVKTNEVPGARTLDDGRGQALFTVNTGVESSGLGCGQLVEPSADGPKVPRCWLVIVPRGAPDVENAGLPFLPSRGVSSSPLTPNAWKNRVAIELQFTPVDSPCDITADQRRINGAELVLGAVSSWQPVLCTRPGLVPYAYGVVPDGLARQQLVSDAQGGPGMVVVNRPFPEGSANPDDPIVYAPLTASAVAIGANVERVGVLGGTDDRRLQGVRYAAMNLTPRLVAKLLTQSYRGQVEIQNSAPYQWDDANPVLMFVDPDFLQFNPEFKLWGAGSAKFAGGLVLPAGTSDLASQLWEWIQADPEAAAWLDGEPDDWGMVVNPAYAARAENNSTGFPFGSPTPDSFPKSDPYCYQAGPINSGALPPQLCALDWFPYASGFAESSRLTAAADDVSKTALDLFAPRAIDAWRRSGPQPLGRRTMLALSDLPSVTRFGLQPARLSQAGDNGADRVFVAPDGEGLRRGVQSMKVDAGMLQLDPTDLDAGAYPLTTVAYGALRPRALDVAAREHYAAFLDYAAGPGQQPGTGLGQLPPGYLPLPSELAETTTVAAAQVRAFRSPAEPSNPPPAQPAEDPQPSPSSAAPDATPRAIGSVSPARAQPSRPRSSASSRATTAPTSDVPTSMEVAAPADLGASSLPSVDPDTPRPMTPIVAVGNGRYTVAVVGGLALLSGYLVLEITKGRPRRRIAAGPRSSATAVEP